jgi:hypothetical protein
MTWKRLDDEKLSKIDEQILWDRLLSRWTWHSYSAAFGSTHKARTLNTIQIPTQTTDNDFRKYKWWNCLGPTSCLTLIELVKNVRIRKFYDFMKLEASLVFVVI